MLAWSCPEDEILAIAEQDSAAIERGDYATIASPERASANLLTCRTREREIDRILLESTRE